MVETLASSSGDEGIVAAAQLLHDFNEEYGEPAPPPAELEAYLAELYVVPDRRGQGHGRELITEAIRVARARGADYAFLITTEDDRAAQRLYEAAGFRRTEGEGGPVKLAYEREL